MPSITDIPERLLLRPSRVEFLLWLADQQLPDKHLEHSLMKIYSEATPIAFTALDMEYLEQHRPKAPLLASDR